jgi:transcriptional regulator with XRE-family HTH domain
MKDRTREALADPKVRRTLEEELLVGEATDTVAGLLESLGLSQRDLAARLKVSPGRVSQILSGENLTLRSLGSLGWALGIRFELNPSPMENREGTPAVDDLPPPAWLARLRSETGWEFRQLDLPVAGKVARPGKPALMVVEGEVRAA